MKVDKHCGGLWRSGSPPLGGAPTNIWPRSFGSALRGGRPRSAAEEASGGVTRTAARGGALRLPPREGGGPRGAPSEAVLTRLHLLHREHLPSTSHPPPVAGGARAPDCSRQKSA
ncbi:hypothetical protein GN956_G12820 [Arapaima gigas]